MSKPRIAFAADHAGFALKDQLKAELEAEGYPVADLGTHGPDSVDYPDFGRKLGEYVAAGQADFGVAICGSGIGISIAANRIPGCRAALVNESLSARLARQHNNANVIAFGARLIGPDIARDCLQAFLATAFEGGRHARRVSKIDPSA